MKNRCVKFYDANIYIYINYINANFINILFLIITIYVLCVNNKLFTNYLGHIGLSS